MTTALQSIGLSELERMIGTDKLASPSPVRDRWGRWKRDPSGAYDWFYALDQGERDHIARKYMGGHVGPDVVAGWLDTDTDSAMEQFVASVRLARSRVSDPFDDEYGPVTYDDDVAELVGPHEVAEMLGVKVNSVVQWRKRGLLPDPTIVISLTPIWTVETITAWAKETNREVVQP